MRYREIPPGPAECQLVDRYWMLEDDGANAGAIQRIVPDGRCELILNLGEPYESMQGGQWKVQPRCFFAGQITGPLFVRSRGQARMLGIRFRPQGAIRVLGVPMHQLTGRITPLEDISERQLQRIDGLDQLRNFVAATKPRDDTFVSEAVRQICVSGGCIDVGTVARNLGVSLRHLQRIFLSDVGITPKLFARIGRFQRVFQAIEQGRQSWVDAAVECGYYDQAHLIRDFRDFAGETPAALLEGADLATHFVRHMPGCRVLPRRAS